MKKNNLFVFIRCLVVFIFLGTTIVFAQEEQEEKKGFVYQEMNKRDPFMPLVTTTGELVNVKREYMLSDLALEGIMTNANGNIAIINGQIIRKNDRVGDFLIEEITSDTVTLLKGTQRSTLRLTKEE
ncbi:MAG: hypothetical protein KC684_08640 [Candidatus Omnitrophica bacterium]|nr:hypothetical protein [Candidatus Omnitrophota bacterium]